MKIPASLALLALLLPAPVATAQASLYNLSIPSNCQATVIDWEGKPALMVVGSGDFVSFKRPDVGPAVQLEVRGLAAWDWQPCAVGNSLYLDSYDLGFPYGNLHVGMGSIPASGLSIGVYHSTVRGPIIDYWLPPKGSYAVMYNWLPWYVHYCPWAGPCGGCQWSRSPQGVCVVAYLSLK